MAYSTCSLYVSNDALASVERGTALTSPVSPPPLPELTQEMVDHLYRVTFPGGMGSAEQQLELKAQVIARYYNSQTSRKNPDPCLPELYPRPTYTSPWERHLSAKLYWARRSWQTHPLNYAYDASVPQWAEDILVALHLQDPAVLYGATDANLRALGMPERVVVLTRNMEDLVNPKNDCRHWLVIFHTHLRSVRYRSPELSIRMGILYLCEKLAAIEECWANRDPQLFEYMHEAVWVASALEPIRDLAQRRTKLSVHASDAIYAESCVFLYLWDAYGTAFKVKSQET